MAQGKGARCAAQEGVAVPLESPAVHRSSTSSKFSLWPVQSALVAALGSVPGLEIRYGHLEAV